MANSWSKQPVWVSGFLNNVNDTIVGGQLSSVPVGVVATQGDQTLLGDHLVLDEAAANAKSTTAAGFAQLHGGYYQYVQLDSAATTPALGQALYWKLSLTTSATGNYAVTNIASGNAPNLAGFLLNPNVTPGNFTWIQCLGRASALFGTGGGAVGGPVFLTTGAATVDQGAGTTSTYVGLQETVSVSGAVSIVDVQKVTLRF